MLTGQLVGQLDQTYAHSDALENELSKQFNSGRMLRILLKTNLINGRPEMAMDRNWSDTGDRYVLSLFSNYLFHQHGPNGEPIVDYGHIIESLNKLDAGSKFFIWILWVREMFLQADINIFPGVLFFLFDCRY
jgi:PAB-dependent poly(A)-specific ribonuclease subunit 3